MEKEHEKVICSWCLKEKGIAPREGDSNGICDRHYKQIMDEMDKEGRENENSQIMEKSEQAF